jgi:hypothetical protein
MIFLPIIQNPEASDFGTKKQKASMIGKELYDDGGTDAMENMFYSIKFRIKDEIELEGMPSNIDPGGTVYQMIGNIRNIYSKI